MDNIQESLFGKTSQEHYLPTEVLTSESSSTKWLKQGRWSLNGDSWMRNTSESPNDAGESSSSLSSSFSSTSTESSSSSSSYQSSSSDPESSEVESSEDDLSLDESSAVELFELVAF